MHSFLHPQVSGVETVQCLAYPRAHRKSESGVYGVMFESLCRLALPLLAFSALKKWTRALNLLFWLGSGSCFVVTDWPGFTGARRNLSHAHFYIVFAFCQPPMSFISVEPQSRAVLDSHTNYLLSQFDTQHRIIADRYLAFFQERSINFSLKVVQYTLNIRSPGEVLRKHSQLLCKQSHPIYLDRFP